MYTIALLNKLSPQRLELPIIGQGCLSVKSTGPSVEQIPVPPDPHQTGSCQKTRTEFGVARPSCACKKCQFFCKVLPGSLIPADLDRLIPPGEDPLAWARVHLRATPYLALVPARTSPGGPCHWLTSDGRCAVHADSPFGCAMYSCKLARAVADRLSHEGDIAVHQDVNQNGLDSRIARTLWEEGLREYGVPAGSAAAHAYATKCDRQAERKQAKTKRKKARVHKKKYTR